MESFSGGRSGGRERDTTTEEEENHQTTTTAAQNCQPCPTTFHSLIIESPSITSGCNSLPAQSSEAYGVVFGMTACRDLRSGDVSDEKEQETTGDHGERHRLCAPAREETSPSLDETSGEGREEKRVEGKRKEGVADKEQEGADQLLEEKRPGDAGNSEGVSSEGRGGITISLKGYSQIDNSSAVKQQGVKNESMAAEPSSNAAHSLSVSASGGEGLPSFLLSPSCPPLPSVKEVVPDRKTVPPKKHFTRRSSRGDKTAARTVATAASTASLSSPLPQQRSGLQNSSVAPVSPPCAGVGSVLRPPTISSPSSSLPSSCSTTVCFPSPSFGASAAGPSFSIILASSRSSSASVTDSTAASSSSSPLPTTSSSLSSHLSSPASSLIPSRTSPFLITTRSCAAGLSSSPLSSSPTSPSLTPPSRSRSVSLDNTSPVTTPSFTPPVFSTSSNTGRASSSCSASTPDYQPSVLPPLPSLPPRCPRQSSTPTDSQQQSTPLSLAIKSDKSSSADASVASAATSPGQSRKPSGTSVSARPSKVARVKAKMCYFHASKQEWRARYTEYSGAAKEFSKRRMKSFTLGFISRHNRTPTAEELHQRHEQLLTLPQDEETLPFHTSTEETMRPPPVLVKQEESDSQDTSMHSTSPPYSSLSSFSPASSICSPTAHSSPSTYPASHVGTGITSFPDGISLEVLSKAASPWVSHGSRKYLVCPREFRGAVEPRVMGVRRTGMWAGMEDLGDLGEDDEEEEREEEGGGGGGQAVTAFAVSSRGGRVGGRGTRRGRGRRRNGGRIDYSKIETTVETTVVPQSDMKIMRVKQEEGEARGEQSVGVRTRSGRVADCSQQTPLVRSSLLRKPGRRGGKATERAEEKRTTEKEGRKEESGAATIVPRDKPTETGSNPIAVTKEESVEEGRRGRKRRREEERVDDQTTSGTYNDDSSNVTTPVPPMVEKTTTPPLPSPPVCIAPRGRRLLRRTSSRAAASVALRGRHAGRPARSQRGAACNGAGLRRATRFLNEMKTTSTMDTKTTSIVTKIEIRTHESEERSCEKSRRQEEVGGRRGSCAIERRCTRSTSRAALKENEAEKQSSRKSSADEVPPKANVGSVLPPLPPLRSSLVSSFATCLSIRRRTAATPTAVPTRRSTRVFGTPKSPTLRSTSSPSSLLPKRNASSPPPPSSPRKNRLPPAKSPVRRSLSRGRPPMKDRLKNLSTAKKASLMNDCVKTEEENQCKDTTMACTAASPTVLPSSTPPFVTLTSPSTISASNPSPSSAPLSSDPPSSPRLRRPPRLLPDDTDGAKTEKEAVPVSARAKTRSQSLRRGSGDSSVPSISPGSPSLSPRPSKLTSSWAWEAKRTRSGKLRCEEPPEKPSSLLPPPTPSTAAATPTATSPLPSPSSRELRGSHSSTVSSVSLRSQGLWAPKALPATVESPVSSPTMQTRRRRHSGGGSSTASSPKDQKTGCSLEEEGKMERMAAEGGEGKKGSKGTRSKSAQTEEEEEGKEEKKDDVLQSGLLQHDVVLVGVPQSSYSVDLFDQSTHLLNCPLLHRFDTACSPALSSSSPPSSSSSSPSSPSCLLQSTNAAAESSSSDPSLSSSLSASLRSIFDLTPHSSRTQRRLQWSRFRNRIRWQQQRQLVSQLLQSSKPNAAPSLLPTAAATNSPLLLLLRPPPALQTMLKATASKEMKSLTAATGSPLPAGLQGNLPGSPQQGSLQGTPQGSLLQGTLPSGGRLLDSSAISSVGGSSPLSPSAVLLHSKFPKLPPHSPPSLKLPFPSVTPASVMVLQSTSKLVQRLLQQSSGSPGLAPLVRLTAKDRQQLLSTSLPRPSLPSSPLPTTTQASPPSPANSKGEPRATPAKEREEDRGKEEGGLEGQDGGTSAVTKTTISPRNVNKRQDVHLPIISNERLEKRASKKAVLRVSDFYRIIEGPSDEGEKYLQRFISGSKESSNEGKTEEGNKERYEELRVDSNEQDERSERRSEGKRQRCKRRRSEVDFYYDYPLLSSNEATDDCSLWMRPSLTTGWVASFSLADDRRDWITKDEWTRDDLVVETPKEQDSSKEMLLLTNNKQTQKLDTQITETTRNVLMRPPEKAERDATGQSSWKSLSATSATHFSSSMSNRSDSLQDAITAAFALEPSPAEQPSCFPSSLSSDFSSSLTDFCDRLTESLSSVRIRVCNTFRSLQCLSNTIHDFPRPPLILKEALQQLEDSNENDRQKRRRNSSSGGERKTRRKGSVCANSCKGWFSSAAVDSKETTAVTTGSLQRDNNTAVVSDDPWLSSHCRNVESLHESLLTFVNSELSATLSTVQPELEQLLRLSFLPQHQRSPPPTPSSSSIRRSCTAGKLPHTAKDGSPSVSSSPSSSSLSSSPSSSSSLLFGQTSTSPPSLSHRPAAPPSLQTASAASRLSGCLPSTPISAPKKTRKERPTEQVRPERSKTVAAASSNPARGTVASLRASDDCVISANEKESSSESTASESTQRSATERIQSDDAMMSQHVSGTPSSHIPLPTSAAVWSSGTLSLQSTADSTPKAVREQPTADGDQSKSCDSSTQPLQSVCETAASGEPMGDATSKDAKGNGAIPDVRDLSSGATASTRSEALVRPSSLPVGSVESGSGVTNNSAGICRSAFPPFPSSLSCALLSPPAALPKFRVSSPHPSLFSSASPRSNGGSSSSSGQVSHPNAPVDRSSVLHAVVPPASRFSCQLRKRPPRSNG